MSRTKTIKSVAKACQLLKEAADMGPFSLAEMARALDEPTSSVDRLLATLMGEGFIERQGSQFQIGKGAARIWSAYCLTLRRLIQQAHQDVDGVWEPINWLLVYGINLVGSDKGKTIKSVAKACLLLREAADMGPFSLAEMARALDEPTSSVDRLLATLLDAGFIERRGVRYQIGKDLARIWSAYCLTLQRVIQQSQQDLDDVQVPQHIITNETNPIYGANPEEWQ